MGRYIANTLERQQELGIKLDNTVILKGVTDGLGKEAKMTDEEIQKRFCRNTTPRSTS